MKDPILRVLHLTVAIGGMEALSDVTFTLPRGSCLGLVGETGSGKTITCRALTGLERRIGATITRGSIELNGQELTGLGEPQWQAIRGRKIALVPQASLSSMDPLMRIGRQLEETISALDPGAVCRERALELLDQVLMPHPADTLRRYPHELSGGMRQRVMIALALAGRPSLLIADEPTTALDVTVQRRILRLLDAIRADTGMSLIFVSHDLGVVRSISDHIAIMYAGATVETGPVAAVFGHPSHPYTRALITAQPAHAARDLPLAAIPGTHPSIGSRPSGCPFAPRCPMAVDQCTREAPVAVSVGSGHDATCWRAGEVAA
jgi:oligopeptide/dipeptide ABC transporter ATP-binding protein